MDRSHEPPVDFEEHKIRIRMTDPVTKPRLWTIPVPLRMKYSDLRSLGIDAPDLPKARNECFTLPLRGSTHILGYPGQRYWLITTVALPDGSTPKDPFASESPSLRVDGESCKGSIVMSSHGRAYMANVDINRATLGGLAAGVLDREPDSRISARLLPRTAAGAVRYFRAIRCLQFWAAI